VNDRSINKTCKKVWKLEQRNVKETFSY